jgi:hypothetical protein
VVAVVVVQEIQQLVQVDLVVEEVEVKLHLVLQM